MRVFRPPASSTAITPVSFGESRIAMQSRVARRDSFIERGFWADKIALVRRK